MTHYVNISELADQVLASVHEEANTKTASAQAPARKYVPVAHELKKLAADLREAGPDDEVGDEDLSALMQDPEVMQLLAALEQNPELLQTIMHGEESAEGMPAEGMPAEGMPAEGMPAEAMLGEQGELSPEEAEALAKAPPEKKAAFVIRKLASQLKYDDDRIRVKRLVKAAHMVNAATGLKHLTEGFK